jgi:hypothetical protein
MYFKIGQSSLGLEDRSHYKYESDITVAYREFIREVALILTNRTLTIDEDINQIFEFEKTIAQVILFRYTKSLSYHFL